MDNRKRCVFVGTRYTKDPAPRANAASQPASVDQVPQGTSRKGVAVSTSARSQPPDPSCRVNSKDSSIDIDHVEPSKLSNTVDIDMACSTNTYLQQGSHQLDHCWSIDPMADPTLATPESLLMLDDIFNVGGGWLDGGELDSGRPAIHGPGTIAQRFCDDRRMDEDSNFDIAELMSPRIQDDGLTDTNKNLSGFQTQGTHPAPSHRSPPRSQRSSRGQSPQPVPPGQRRRSGTSYKTSQYALRPEDMNRSPLSSRKNTSIGFSGHTCWVKAVRTLELALSCPPGVLVLSDYVRFIGNLKRIATCFAKISKCAPCLKSPVFPLLVSTCLEKTADTAAIAGQILVNGQLDLATSSISEDYGVHSTEEFIAMYSPIFVDCIVVMKAVLIEFRNGCSGNLSQTPFQSLRSAFDKLSVLENDLREVGQT